MLIEGLAYSFVSRKHDDSCRMYLRLCIANGKLKRNIDTATPIFWRSFEYFDTNANDSLTLREVGTGLARACRGEFSMRAAFLFFITDVNNNGELSHHEVIEFFRYFAELYAAVGVNTLTVERPFLLQQGMPPEELTSQVENIQTQLENSDAYIQEMTMQTFAELDKDADELISYSEWMENVEKIPKLYVKLSNMFVAVVQCEAPVFHQLQHNFISHDMMVPELRGLDFSSKQAETVVEMFNTYSTSNRMSAGQLQTCLTEAFASSFIAELPARPNQAKDLIALRKMEAAFESQKICMVENSRQLLREWSTEGKLNCGLAPQSVAFFKRVFVLFDTHNVGKLDLRAFGTGMSKMCSRKFAIVAQFLFSMTDTENEGELNASSLEKFFRMESQLLLKLHLNVLKASKQVLKDQGMQLHQLEQAQLSLNSQLRNVQNIVQEACDVMRSMLECEMIESITFGDFLHQGMGKLPAVKFLPDFDHN